jgi:pSer/pThr/pTyr-binding forkhead associated (FHA) protein
MVQLTLLSGKQPAVSWNARHFPACVGRSPENDFQLGEAGVWDQHFQIDLNPAQGFVLRVEPNAIVTLNGHSVQEARLRNGDIIEIGSLKLRFSLGETRQRGLRWRESLTWAAIGAVCLGQIALIYWLLS